MSSPQPAEAVSGLYNELVRLQPSDRAAIGRIVWQLRTLRRAKPADAATTVALAQSLALNGEPAEACALAEELWGRRHLMSADVTYSYGDLLVDLGKFERAVELARLVEKGASGGLGRNWRLLATHSAFGCADLASVRHFGTLHLEESASAPGTDALLDELGTAGLLPHVGWHQHIVNTTLVDRITRFELVVMAPDGPPEVGLCYYTPASRTERRTLTAMIDDAIERETEARGLPPGLFVPTLVVNLFDHNAQPPYKH